MLVNQSQTVHLSFISTDLPTWNVIEAQAAIYQKEPNRFHLLLNEQDLPYSICPDPQSDRGQGILWIEISPYRVMMIMQCNPRLSYRHFWERGVFGASRYCLNSEQSSEPNCSMRFRNFTRYLQVDCEPFPHSVRIEYELWSFRNYMGSYVFHMDIEH